MTLTISIAAPWGLWHASDHRLTELPSYRAIDRFSNKQLILESIDGKALITYSGLGRVDGLSIGDWLRGLLRGCNRSIDGHIVAIREAANEFLAPIAYRARIEHALWKVGRDRSFIVQHRLAETEAALVDTDSAMRA